MRIPNLYLKWHVFRELVDLVDTDKDVGLHLFRSEGGAEAFAKLLRGDIACPSDIADGLTVYMNRRMAAQITRTAGEEVRPPLSPSDLALPTLTFAGRLVEALPDIPEARRTRAHEALLRDMTLVAPGQAAAGTAPRLVVERTSMSRTFGSTVLPSGGEGPLVFTAGQHKGQLAVIGVPRDPLAAYVMFTRDPARRAACCGISSGARRCFGSHRRSARSGSGSVWRCSSAPSPSMRCRAVPRDHRPRLAGGGATGARTEACDPSGGSRRSRDRAVPDAAQADGGGQAEEVERGRPGAVG